MDGQLAAAQPFAARLTADASSKAAATEAEDVELQAAAATRFTGARQKSSDLQRLAHLVSEAAAASAPSALR